MDHADMDQVVHESTLTAVAGQSARFTEEVGAVRSTRVPAGKETP